MTREEWNYINDDLINMFHWIDEFEETHPETEIQELRYHLIGLYDWLQDEPIEDKELRSSIISTIIGMGKDDVKQLELPPSDLSDVIYSICSDITHGVFLQLKKEGIIEEGDDRR